MGLHKHSHHFGYFFKQLNPSTTYEKRASSEYNSIKQLIEDRRGLAAALAPTCFLQGSYQRETAIYSINDVDIVALCNLRYPPYQGPSASASWNRDQIFNTVAAPLMTDARYRGKVGYTPKSMCIKVYLGIKVEILPVVYQSGNNDPSKEPFYLFHPETGVWEIGYARYHQYLLTDKNQKTGGNFIPAVKVFKHLRSQARLDIASFHIECLLFQFPDTLYMGGPSEFIPALLRHLASYSATVWWLQNYKTPCLDRDLFSAAEWSLNSWSKFHYMTMQWNLSAQNAANEHNDAFSRAHWQQLLGADYFPFTVS